MKQECRAAANSNGYTEVQQSNILHYGIQQKRGKESMDAIGILTNYKGTSVHGRWAPYDNYTCTQALCNAQLLRELKYLKEEMGRQWASKMITLPASANNLKKENKLDTTAIHSIEKALLGNPITVYQPC